MSKDAYRKKLLGRLVRAYQELGRPKHAAGNPQASSSYSLGVDQIEQRGAAGWPMDVLKAGPNDPAALSAFPPRACSTPLYWSGTRGVFHLLRGCARLSPSVVHPAHAQQLQGWGWEVQGVGRDGHHLCRERRVSEEPGESNRVGQISMY